jgi:hypothetical protein
MARCPPLTLTHGSIEANNIESAGYVLNGNTGADIFTGAAASGIALNSPLINDPGLVSGKFVA